MNLKILKIIFIASVIFALSACESSNQRAESDATPISKSFCESVGLPVKSANERVINGEACGGLASSAIVRVAALVLDQGQQIPIPICTGTLVSSDDVLTAAHCFSETNLAGLPIVGWGIIVGEVGAASYIPANIVAIYPGLNFAADRLFGDAALMQLVISPGLPVLPVLLSSSAQAGQEALVYGYGARFEGDAGAFDPELFYDLNAGTMKIENVTENHLFVLYNGSGSNVCNGDSGGPMVLPVAGVPTLIGVVSQGTTEGCIAGDVTTMTNLQDPGVLNWLVSSVPDIAVFSSLKP